MGAINNSVPVILVDELRREFGLTTFIETGLGQGTSAIWAEWRFSRVISIENDYALIAQFKERYPHSEVEIVAGDSGVMIGGVVSRLENPALFWLDAHTDDYTPILAELAAINASHLPHFILIDDLRLFGAFPEWPTLAELTRAAMNDKNRATFDVDDVMVVVPMTAMQKVSRILAK